MRSALAARTARMAWLRPALAVAGAVVLVVAGVFALGQIRGARSSAWTTPADQRCNSSQTGGPTATPYGGGTTLKNSRSPSLGRSGTPKPGCDRGAWQATPVAVALHSAAAARRQQPVAVAVTAQRARRRRRRRPRLRRRPRPEPIAEHLASSHHQQRGPLSQEAIGTTALVVCERSPRRAAEPDEPGDRRAIAAGVSPSGRSGSPRWRPLPGRPRRSAARWGPAWRPPRLPG